MIIKENYNSTSLFFTLSAILVLIWYARKYIKAKNLNPSPLPPGPRGLPMVGNLLSLEPELHSYFASLSQTYGPILKLRLGSKLKIIVTSPSLAREVLKENDIVFANRDVPNVTRSSAYGVTDIVWTSYGPEWRMLRKVCVLKMLSNATLDSVYSLRRRAVRRGVSQLYNRVESPVDVGEHVFFSILNLIMNMLWGGTVDGDEGASVGAEFREIVSGITELLSKPNISDFFPGLAWFDFQGISKRNLELTRSFDKIFDRMISIRMNIEKDGGNGRNDFLQFLLRLKDEEDSKTPLTITHVKSLLLDMVVGGTDTSSNAIEFAMAEIMNEPEIMKKAQKELEAVVGKDNIVEESHLSKLPYLQAVMKETLRLHPTLPLLVPHSPSETCVVGGYSVPKGCGVIVNVWAIHRDPSNWENPLKFEPERFLKDSPKWDFTGSDLKYFPFGSGRRNCAGIAMAERMVMYSLATLLHSFDWEVPHGQKLDLSERFGIVMKKKIPLVAIPTPRLSDPALYE
ncbi:flavonoid 3'-monooxygenase CYP75B137-like [Humulus lupulus]|uniref:flavonoid 3'-monooxygenase CYP75B137-like n=1 Tax=Humulus lupulus TaxID=3486 RepID=UPI002B40B577|nr:flavonoid 3'-monooxygenase CYP75B137-like [Humulus lupulus]